MRSQAVILAGGKGTRLLPLTEKIPKPLVPIAGITAFERIVNLLKNNGIVNIAVTTMYLAEKIEKIRVKNCQIDYFREREPLGTAGGVKRILSSLEDTFVVINGDDVCNFNIKKAIKHHKENKSKITVLLYRTSDPTSYGNVILKNGVISAFEEKPSWNGTVSNLINTGIYVLEKDVFDHCKDGFTDFSKDLFPCLMQNGIEIHGLECEGFWYDIGDIGSYYKCNFSFAPKLSNIVGKNVKAGRHVRSSGCILHDNVSIGEGTVLKDSIICSGVIIGKNCVVNEGCVIGAGSVIEDGAVIMSGMTVASDMYVGKGKKVMRNIMFGGINKNLFSDKGISGTFGIDIDGEFMVKLGKTFNEIFKDIGVMSDGNKRSNVLKKALICGISENGGKVSDDGDGFAPLLRFCLTEYGHDLAVFISESDGAVLIKIYDKNGLKISHDVERLIEQKFSEPFTLISEPKEALFNDCNETKKRYKSYLSSFIVTDIKNSFAPDKKSAAIDISSSNELSELLLSLGIFQSRAKEKICVTNEKIYAECENGETLSYWHIVSIILKYGDKSRMIALPVMIPQSVVEFLYKSGYDLVFYGDRETKERIKARDDMALRDPGSLAVMLYQTAVMTGKTLAELKKELPDFYVETQNFEYDDDLKAKCITELAERDGALQLKTGGVRILGDGGSVMIIPRYEGGFRLFAEALSVEAAKEMFFDVKKMIKDVK